MLTIYELSRYQLGRIYAIDANLDRGWQKTLKEVFDVLDDEGRKNIVDKVLKPRNIEFNALNETFLNQPPPSFKNFCSSFYVDNRKIARVIEDLNTVLDNRQLDQKIDDVADLLEAIFHHLNEIELDNVPNPPLLKKQLKTSFLYDFAKWIDEVEFAFDAGIRQLTRDMVKSYIKEVYIKQQIQGRDFRSWNGEEINYLGVEHFPKELRDIAHDRKLHVIESHHYWFMVGPADKAGQNPYSLRRFLNEDVGRTSVFLTHVVIPRQMYIDKENVRKFLLNCLSRIYTLDRSISADILKFFADAREINQTHLTTLLKKRLSGDGREPEMIISERLVDYEKKLTSLILIKIPSIFRMAFQNIDDLEYLEFHLEKFLMELQNNIEEFKLYPLVRNSASARETKARLIALQLFLQKLNKQLQDIIVSKDVEKLNEPLRLITATLEDSESSLQQLEAYRQKLQDYDEKVAKGGLWVKLGMVKKPDFTEEDIQNSLVEVQENLFIEIVRIAKVQRQFMSYIELETGQTIDESYRHYAILDPKKQFGALPIVFSMPEDRLRFDPKDIREVLERDIFKSTVGLTS